LTEIQALEKLIREGDEVSVVDTKRGDKDTCSLLAVPNTMRLESLKKFVDEYLPFPDRRKGNTLLKDLDSFIEHVKRFKDDDTLIFANPHRERPSLIAVYDYHRQGPDGQARWGEHRAKYPFPLSDEWKAWSNSNDKGMTQEAFCQFIEDRILDISDPSKAKDQAKEFAKTLECEFASPSRMLELSRGLSVSVAARVANAQTLASGERQITYHESHSDSQGKPLKVPSAFLLTLPVFRGAPVYEVCVRLRYRVAEQRITWSYSIYRIERVFEHSFKEAVAKVAKDTGLLALLGKAEFKEATAPSDDE
jgi:uncharacterized protein YfdQ (DUF2303 family)